MKSSFTYQIRHLFCVTLLLMLSGLAQAQDNLLQNGAFDNDLADWEVLEGRKAEWNSSDAAGSMTSGSALIANQADPSNGGIPLVLRQCVRVSPSTEYSFGGQLMIPSGQPTGTEAEIFLYTYFDSVCGDRADEQDEESSSSVGEWESESSLFTTESDIRSISINLGVYKPNGESAEAVAHFDNVFLRSNGVFSIGPSMSASWYNPDESGHGIMIHLMDSTQAWMCWFTFDQAGNPAWICALGTISGDTIVFNEAFTVEGGMFPPLFDPSLIVEVPWGSITVTFTGCNSGEMVWTTTAAGFESGSMPLSRLTPLWGNSCP